ncbi:MAG: site-2 protease family protein [bacterium]|nr:site-2 protease family protein [bacterium]
MGIILFIAILLLLIISHEFGHFIVAKWVGMRVDEFGVGFPPRLWGKKIGETIYSINLVPFGGFVSIFGENYNEVMAGEHDSRNFSSSPKWAQALVLLAGVTMNWLVALVIIIAGFVYGLPVSASQAPADAALMDSKLLITQVYEGSAAQVAGLVPGDRILFVATGAESVQGDPLEPAAVSDFISSHQTDEVLIGIERQDQTRTTITATPTALSGDTPILGITMSVVGIAQLPFVSAVVEGVRTTSALTVAIVYGFGNLIMDLFAGSADLSAISGPIGLVSMVGSASEIGMIYVFTLTAIISLNLAVLNLLPFPALDGGRLLFVAIEAIKGSPISPRIANGCNMAGFVALILLMVVITISDIIKL